MQVLTSQVPTLAEYLAYLSRQRDLHVALEAALTARLPAAWGSERLVKRSWLESDIRALLAPGSALPAPASIHLHPIASLADALGTLYVLEGSTLGLRMIEQRLPPGHPGLGSAGRFIRGYGEAHGLRWRTFLESLEALPARDWPRATVAARATFRVFLAHFAGSERAICGAPG